MNCLECGSNNVQSITNDELRRLHLLKWVCFDCRFESTTGWDIDLPPRPDILEHFVEHKDKIMAYVSKNAEVPEKFVEIKDLLNEIFEVDWLPYSEWDSYRFVVSAEDKDRILTNVTQVILKLKETKNEKL